MKGLTGRGALAALAVGLATMWGFGWRGVVMLLAFFVTGSLLTRVQGGGRQRNERQVLANGGVAALAALLGSWAAFAGSLAAATADTWATEIGKYSRTPPRLITNGTPVPTGTDGGITALGTVGGLAGAAVIGVLSGSVAVVSLAGMFGMLLDSLLGATVQGRLRWLDNDAVNLAATVSGAGVALLASRLCCR